MKRNTKLAILIVLVMAAIFVWMLNGGKDKHASPPVLSGSFNQSVPTISAVPTNRTKFTGWPRDPFAKPRTEERKEQKKVGPVTKERKKQKKVGAVSDLKLSGIAFVGTMSSAIINGTLVMAGDRIGGKTVKKIERNRVILADETTEYVLRLSR